MIRAQDHPDLEQANARLAAIVSSSDDAIASKTLEGIVTSWNQAAERMFGYAPSEIIGNSITMIIPADRQSEEQDILARIARGESIAHFETLRRRKDGSILPVSVTISPLRDADGRIIGASKIARDISEKQRADQSRALLSAIVESSDDAIITKDLDGTITTWNSGAERIFGYSAAEIVGKPVLLLIPEELHPEEERILSRIRRGERIDHFETRRRRKDGRLLHVSLSVSPLRDSQGRIVGASKIARDISERSRVQEQLKEINSELERRVEKRTVELREAVREIEGFAYTVAHDLRAPLRAMVGFGEIVVEEEKGKLGEGSTDRLQRIVDAGKRMDSMLQDLLAYSRLSREKIPIEAIDPGALIRGVLAQMEPLLAQTRARVLVEGEFPRVLGNPTTLTMVFTNLIENAAKFVKPGVPPEIRIHAEARVGGTLRLWVEDNGIGIAPEYHPQIFGVFQRLHDAGTFPGTGIGLAIVKRATERMGGRAGLESEPGRGSRFFIDLRRPDGDPLAAEDNSS